MTRGEHAHDLSDLPPFLLSDIAHFFQIHKQIEPGKETHCYGWEGAATAERVTAVALRRHEESVAQRRPA